MDDPLSITRVECPKCGAIWLDGKHVWRTGVSSPDSERDLASLVCQPFGNFQCINPKRNLEGGDTWEKRREDLDSLFKQADTDL